MGKRVETGSWNYTTTGKHYFCFAVLHASRVDLQCAQRWEQLRDSWPVVGDHSGLSAEGKLIGHSSTALAVRRQPPKHTHTRSTYSLKPHASSEKAETTVGADSDESASVRSPEIKDGTLARAERIQSGKFVTNYCQSIVNGRSMEPDTREPAECTEKSLNTNPVKYAECIDVIFLFEVCHVQVCWQCIWTKHDHTCL